MVSGIITNGKEEVAKDCEKVTDMQPGILYYPQDPLFPGADFVFVKPEEKNSNEKKKRVFYLQGTFAEMHKKKGISVQCFSRKGEKVRKKNAANRKESKDF